MKNDQMITSLAYVTKINYKNKRQFPLANHEKTETGFHSKSYFLEGPEGGYNFHFPAQILTKSQCMKSHVWCSKIILIWPAITVIWTHQCNKPCKPPFILYSQDDLYFISIDTVLMWNVVNKLLHM
jgi:hypothetical protein